MPVRLRLIDIAKLINAEIVGDGDVTITGVASLDEAKEGDLAFLEDLSLLPLGEQSRAAALIVPPQVRSARKPLIVTEDPKLAFSQVLELFKPEPSIPKGVHDTAILGRNVRLGADVAIGPYVVIEDNVRIGDRVVIYPFAFIGRDTEIGDDTIIYPHVFIGERTTIGRRCIIHAGASIGADGFGFLQTEHGHKKIPQIGIVILEDDVEVGANSTIDRATVSVTRIGRGTKIDDQVHVAHNCVIGENCLLCGQVGIAGSARIGNNVVMGGQAGVSDHVTIADNVTLAAQAGVFGDITEPGVYSGYPARPHSQQLRALALVQKLPQMHQQLRQLQRQMEEIKKALEELKRGE